MKQKSILVALAMLVASTTGIAQDDNPWQGLKLNPKSRVKLDFHNASSDAVITWYQKATGITIIKDPALTGGLTITSATPVSLLDALDILRTTLGLKNFDVSREGKNIVIKARPKDSGGGGRQGGGGAPDMSAMAGMFQPPAKQVLKVYPIKYASSSQVARVLNEVFGVSSNQGGGGFPFGGGFGGFGGGGGGNRFAQMFAAAGGGGRNNQPTLHASSDDYSNSVIVLAALTDQEQVKSILGKIDIQTDSPQLSKVYKLQFASANDLAPVVQNILVSNTSTGRGGLGGQDVPIQQRFQQAARLGGSQAGFGQVVADNRSNSLVVTGAQQVQDVVDKVIKELDKPQEVQNSTFVFPLDNARADQVATLLNQAFGVKQGSNPNFQFNNRTSGTNTNRTSTNSTNRPPTLGGENVNPDDGLALQMQDPGATSGDLMTSVTTAQGFGQGGFGGGGGFFQNLFRGGNANTNQQGGGAIGRDSQGRIINLRDLTGQITVIPDTNTNSLIVVTTPEYAEVVRHVLAQLDRIPEQVMIETTIVEASLSAEDKLGVQWSKVTGQVLKTPGSTSTFGTNFGVPSNGTGFNYSITANNLTAMLNALATDQKFDVLSTPRIFTSNNQQATINISQSVPYVTSTSISTTGSSIFNYSFLDVGIVLTVTPRITQNGYVTLDVSQTANDLQGYTSFNAPIVNQREANTTVSVKDGETIVLGGIIRNAITTTTNKVPLLGDIPLLGNLFKSTDKTKAKTELMIFLTPRVVHNETDAKKLREKSQNDLDPSVKEKVKAAINPALKGTSGGGN